MSDYGQPRQTLSGAIKNGTGAYISRMITIVCVPATLAMGGWIGSNVVSAVHELSEKVDRQHDDVMVRINGLDVRMTGTEHDVADLKRRADR